MLLPLHAEASMLLLNCLNQVLTPLLTNSTVLVATYFDLKFPMPIAHYGLDQEEIHFFSFTKPDIYVVDARRRRLSDTLMYLEKRTFYNPRATFVIVTARIKPDLHHILKAYFIHRYIILEHFAMDKILVHSDAPIKIKKKGLFTKKEKIVTLIKVGASYNVPNIILKDGQPKTGIDMEILGIISKKLNFRTELSIVEAFAGTKNENFSFNGALGSLERREVDLVIGGIYPTKEGSMSFDFTQTTSVNRYVWIVPAAKVRPFWKRLVFTFSLTVWTMVIATALILLVLLSLINRTILKGYYNWDGELLKLYSMCFTPVAVKRSETRSKKILYTSWYMFLLIFLNHFTAKLLSNLMVKNFEHQIYNLEELRKVDWKICIFSDLEKDIVAKHSLKRTMSCTNCETCTNQTAYEGNLVTIRSEKLTLYEMGKFYSNEEREPLVFILDQAFLSTYDVMVFRKNHPLFRRFNQVLGYLLESGVDDRIRKKYSSAEVERDQKNRWMGLKLQQLAFILEFLYYGWSLSFLIFICEVFVNKIYTIFF